MWAQQMRTISACVNTLLTLTAQVLAHRATAAFSHGHAQLAKASILVALMAQLAGDSHMVRRACLYDVLPQEVGV